MINNRMYNILIDWMRESECTCGYKIRNTDEGNHALTIYSNRPGLLIGKSGSRIEKYKKLLQKEDRYLVTIEIEEVDAFLNGSSQKISDEDYIAGMADWFKGHGM